MIKCWWPACSFAQTLWLLALPTKRTQRESIENFIFIYDWWSFAKLAAHIEVIIWLMLQNLISLVIDIYNSWFRNGECWCPVTKRHIKDAWLLPDKLVQPFNQLINAIVLFLSTITFQNVFFFYSWRKVERVKEFLPLYPSRDGIHQKLFHVCCNENAK